MSNSSKLKPIKWGLILVLIMLGSIFCISIFALVDSFLSGQSKLTAYGLIWLGFTVFNLVIWIIRKDLVSLSFILINLTLAVSYLSDYKEVFIIIPLIIMYSFYFYIVYVNYKVGSRYRKILELAAQPVKNKTDGFTSRPFPVGKISFSKEERLKFARFLKKYLIAFPYSHQNGILLAIKDHSKFWFGRLNEIKDTYISFHFDGTLAVNIARKDYQKYKEEYTFNELCHSLGALFKRFLDYYQQGKESQILAELNDGYKDLETKERKL